MVDQDLYADIERFATKLQTAQNILLSAEAHFAAGQTQQQQRYHRLAVEQYAHATQKYAEVSTFVQEIASLRDPLPMAILRKQRQTAQTILETAEQQTTLIESAAIRRQALASMQEAERLMAEARSAALENNFSAAHTYAEEALKEDASLTDEVIAFRRETPHEQPQGVSPLVRWAIAIVLFGALIWFVGIPQAQRVWSDLNPTTVAAVPTRTPPLPSATPREAAIQPTPLPIVSTIRQEVNVLEEPSAGSLVLFRLTIGDSVVIQHFIGTSSEPIWFEIESNGQIGWVLASAVEAVGSLPAQLEQK